MTQRTTRAPSATTKQDTSFSVTDANGRVIVYRPLDIVEQYDLSRALGKDSGNESMLLMASLAAGVRSIDKAPRPFPSDDAEIKAALRALDTAGLMALQAEMVERQKKMETPTEVEAEVKNS